MVVIITFMNCGDIPIFRIELSVEEWEIAMLCIIKKDENYPFMNDVVYDKKYIKAFWFYFNLRDKCFDVIEYEGLFITDMRVKGYDALQFDSWKNNRVFHRANKRKHDGDDE